MRVRVPRGEQDRGVRAAPSRAPASAGLPASSRAPGLEIALVQVGESRVELLAPISDKGIIAGARPGMHHVAYAVNDIDVALERLRSLDVKLIDTAARKGTHDSRVAFIHPHATGGVLTELVEAAHA